MWHASPDIVIPDGREIVRQCIQRQDESDERISTLRVDWLQNSVIPTINKQLGLIAAGKTVKKKWLADYTVSHTGTVVQSIVDQRISLIPFVEIITGSLWLPEPLATVYSPETGYRLNDIPGKDDIEYDHLKENPFRRQNHVIRICPEL